MWRKNSWKFKLAMFSKANRDPNWRCYPFAADLGIKDLSRGFRNRGPGKLFFEFGDDAFEAGDAGFEALHFRAEADAAIVGVAAVHAAVAGQFALEQTFYLDVEAMTRGGIVG